jgi:3-hydroxyisobutyrate dehydrogenase
VTDIRNIGFIGLGSMGGRQTRELAKLPIPLTVFDVSPAAMAVFAGKAKLAGGIADVGRDADVIGLCVQDDAQVDECVDQLLLAMKPGAVLLIHSTVRPATVIAAAARAAERGVHLLEAPVSRTDMGEDGPFVFCMTGGEETVATRVQEVLDAFATDRMHVGPVGSAMTLKICNNLASWSAIMIGLEAVDLAEAAGVPIDKLMTVMTRNGVLTPPAQAFAAFRNNRGGEEQRRLMAVQAVIGEKDLRLAMAVAADTGAEAPIAAFIAASVKDKILEICRR